MRATCRLLIVVVSAAIGANPGSAEDPSPVGLARTAERKKHEWFAAVEAAKKAEREWLAAEKAAAIAEHKHPGSKSVAPPADKDATKPVRKVHQGVLFESWLARDFDRIPADVKIEANTELGVMVKLNQATGYVYVLRQVDAGTAGVGFMLVYPKPNALNDEANKSSAGELFPTGPIDYAPDAGKTAMYYVVAVPKEARRDKLDVAGLSKSAGQSVFAGPDDFLKRVLADKTAPSVVGEQVLSITTKK